MFHLMVTTTASSAQPMEIKKMIREIMESVTKYMGNNREGFSGGGMKKKSEDDWSEMQEDVDMSSRMTE